MPSVLKPLQGDTALKQMLGQALLQSRCLVGEEHFDDNCLRRLTKSQELAEASAYGGRGGVRSLHKGRGAS